MADIAAAVSAPCAAAEQRPPATPRPVIVTADDPGREQPEVDTARWADLAAAVLGDEHVSGGELGLLFVDLAEMASLNREHMGGDGPTDVLAFPLDGADADPAATAAGAGALLGDVVVCPARAAAQAAHHAGPGHDGSLEDELALLVVHGVLHVLGYDHADGADAAVMQARERQLLVAHHCRP